jgi:hypothetical protein
MRREILKLVVVLVASSLLSTGAYAAKPCDELKAEIAAKLDAKGVKGYTLEAVPNDQVGDREVVGSCEGGTRKIVYTRQ